MAKLDETLTTARQIVRGSHGASRYLTAFSLSEAIIDLVGEDLPCGFEPPTPILDPDGHQQLHIEALVGSREEARAYAAAILRAADETWPDE